MLERRDREEQERTRSRLVPEQPNGSDQDHTVKGHLPEIAEQVQSESHGGASSSGTPMEEDVVMTRRTSLGTFNTKKEHVRLMALLVRRLNQLLVVSLPSKMFISQQRTGRVGTTQDERDQGILLLRVAVRACRFQWNQGVTSSSNILDKLHLGQSPSSQL